jgi:hypothetical protein
MFSRRINRTGAQEPVGQSGEGSNGTPGTGILLFEGCETCKSIMFPDYAHNWSHLNHKKRKSLSPHCYSKDVTEQILQNRERERDRERERERER